jgi:hypothetical protein
MGKCDLYRQVLVQQADWDAYLLAESGLPGPRGNLELAQVVADMADADRIERYAALDEQQAPENTSQVFLAFCGIVGLGRLLCEGQTFLLPILRRHAADPRWRIREAVAMALQRYGDHGMEALLAEMQHWAQGSFLEQRAAVAALCEPRLLQQARHAEQVLCILDRITASIQQAGDRAGEPFQVLRKGLGYGWSVAVAALPDVGKPLLERWFACEDRDIRWIMKDNLRKNRLVRMDAAWTDHWRAELGV